MDQIPIGMTINTSDVSARPNQTLYYLAGSVIGVGKRPVGIAIDIGLGVKDVYGGVVLHTDILSALC